MSGNNPHGHLSQPQNSSWNSLQLEQLNPLLPPFARGPPFDSMDLSLQSNRNSSSPLTKGLSASVPPEFGHKPPPPPPPHSQNNFPIHNLSTNSNVHHSQSMSSVPPPPLSKYMNTNGNDVDMQQPPTCGGLYIRDTERINDDYAKMTRDNRSCENDIQSNLTKPVELVKECTYTNLSNKVVPSSPKKVSPPPNQLQQQQQLQLHLQQQYSCSANGPNSPENTRLTHITNFNTPLNHMLTETSASGSCLPPKCGTDLTTTQVTENSCNSLSTNDSPANVTSNEDSVDSSGSRTRRKRKPNKTVRMSHDSETDENISLGEQVSHHEKRTPPPLSAAVDVSNNNGTHILQPEIGLNLQQETAPAYSEHRISDVPDALTPLHQTVEKLQVTNDEQVDTRSNTEESDENLHASETSEITNNNQVHRSDSDDVETIDKIAEMIAKSSSESSAPNSEDPMSNSSSNGTNKKESPSPVEINDEDENVDKSPLNAEKCTRDSDTVAESVSSAAPSKPNELTNIFASSDPSSQNETSQKSTPSPELPPPTTEPSLKCEAAETSRNVEASKPSPDNKPDKSTFEEVEYKLEEMFAGIEDEPQVANAVPGEETGNNEVTNDLSLALALPTTKIKNDDDDDSEHKPLSALASTSNAAQKRLHSTPKSEPGPAKKRARLTKKQSNKKNKGKVNSSSTGAGKGSVAQGNRSKGGGAGGGGGVASCGSANGANGTSVNSKSLAAKVEDASISNAAAESKYRGPYVLVKPDGSINIINAPIAEDDAEKVSKVKKGPYTHVDRSKIRGIHMSTLGNKYDADTADATWMCVFCKKGPHKFGLGDLFGPYIITTKCEEFESTERDDIDIEFVSRRKKCEMFQKTPYSLPVVPASHSNASNVNNKKKKKFSESQTSIASEKCAEEKFFGMSKVSDTSYEVWLHEDCAVWAPGVFLIGARIVGLESSVWTSANYVCSLCSQKGAMICCLQRGCGEKAHIPCARLSNWDLNEGDFKTYCDKHAQTVSLSS